MKFEFDVVNIGFCLSIYNCSDELFDVSFPNVSLEVFRRSIHPSSKHRHTTKFRNSIPTGILKIYFR